MKVNSTQRASRNGSRNYHSSPGRLCLAPKLKRRLSGFSRDELLAEAAIHENYADRITSFAYLLHGVGGSYQPITPSAAKRMNCFWEVDGEDREGRFKSGLALRGSDVWHLRYSPKRGYECRKVSHSESLFIWGETMARVSRCDPSEWYGGFDAGGISTWLTWGDKVVDGED